MLGKLRSRKTDNNVLILKVNVAAGRGGSSGRYDPYREVAFDFAFLLTQLRIEK
jgi:oligopeptidase B